MRDLNRIVNRIRRHEIPGYRTNKVTEMTLSVQPRLTSIVSSILRKHIQSSYVLGISYVGSLPSFQNVSGYVTHRDLDMVKELTQQYLTRFWGRLAHALSKENTVSTEFLNQSEALLLNPNYIVNSLAIGATNEALNVATVAKARALTGLSVISTEKNVGVAQFDEFEFSDLPLDLELTAVWVTSMDEGVCEICEGFEGEYRLDDFDLPQPVDDSHPNCRCRILIEGAA